MKRIYFNFLWMSALLFLAAGCQVDQRSSAAALPTAVAAATSTLAQPPAEPDLRLSSPTPSIQAALLLSPLPPNETPAPLPSALSATPSPTACPAELCVYTGAFPLARPIDGSYRDTIDPSYRFGSTQGKQRDLHHGVEFLDPLGTPVLAAGDGVVAAAGDDTQTLYAPYYNFYGNLVVLKHELPGVPQPVYTLYAHLSEILVREGARVEMGQQIGVVGMSGSATGSHLHFEVRLGENSYAAARNPELWLAPLPDETGQPGGAIAGRILAPQGFKLDITSVVLERLPSPQQAPISLVYLGVYEDEDLLGLPPWKESFAAGDLPAGWYRLSFIQYGLQERLVQVFPGQLTVVTFQLGTEGP